jgi:hypothetical protein
MLHEVIRRVALAMLASRNDTIGFWDLKYIYLYGLPENTTGGCARTLSTGAAA